MIKTKKKEKNEERKKRTEDSKEQIKLLIKQKKEEKKKKLIEDIKNKNKEEQNKIKKDIINKRILKVKKKFKIEDNFETNYAKYKDQTQANNPENKENELDENLKKFFSEIDKYDKYILDKNYCSDFKDEDINDSDISYDFNEVIQEVAKKNKIEKGSAENENGDDNDINKEFMQQIIKLKTAKEAKEFYYKEKLKINLKEEQGIKEREKIFNKYLEGLQWVLYYYYNSIKNWKWFYPYHYAPMISDYKEINIDSSLYNVYDNFQKDKSEPFDPYQSLLFILPKESFNLLPECYKEIPLILKEYFPDKVDIDYNGKTNEYESLLLLPVLDEEKMVEIEKKYRKLTKEEEDENKWGTSFMFNKNDNQSENISFNEFEIYQKNINNIEKKEYQITKCDFSFPTLKTIEYHHQLTNIKQNFGRTSYITKQIVLFPKIKEYITNTKIYRYLEFKTIFVDYPFKAFGEIVGYVYSRYYNY
jgi:5'-3' exonuclease